MTCRNQYQVKRPSSLIKKEGKVQLKVLKCKTFSFLLRSFMFGHGILYYKLKNTMQIIAWILLSICILYSATVKGEYRNIWLVYWKHSSVMAIMLC